MASIIDYLSIIPAEVSIQNRRSEVSPEVKLAAAVLLRAISDARGEQGVKTEVTDINDAIAWLTGSGDEIHQEYFNFWVQEALQLDPELVRSKLLPRLGLDTTKDTKSELRRHSIKELEAKAAEMNRLRPSRRDLPRVQQDQRWIDSEKAQPMLYRKPEVMATSQEEPIMELKEQLDAGLKLLDSRYTALEDKRRELEERERQTEMALLRVGSQIADIEKKREILDQAVRVLQDLNSPQVETKAVTVETKPAGPATPEPPAETSAKLDDVIVSALHETPGVKLTVEDVLNRVIAHGYKFKPWNKQPKASVMTVLSTLTSEGRVNRELAPDASGVSVRKKVYWVDKE